jgi:hypothetical protein
VRRFAVTVVSFYSLGSLRISGLTLRTHCYKAENCWDRMTRD